MYSDPHIPKVKTHSHASLQSKQLTAETLQKANCVMCTTNQDANNMKLVQQHAKLIVVITKIKDSNEKV